MFGVYAIFREHVYVYAMFGKLSFLGNDGGTNDNRTKDVAPYLFKYFQKSHNTVAVCFLRPE